MGSPSIREPGGIAASVEVAAFSSCDRGRDQLERSILHQRDEALQSHVVTRHSEHVTQPPSTAAIRRSRRRRRQSTVGPAAA